MTLENLPLTDYGCQRGGIIPMVRIPYSLFGVIPLIEFNNVGKKYPSVINDIEKACKNATGYKFANDCTQVYAYAGGHISFPYHVNIGVNGDKYDWEISIYKINESKIIFSLSGKDCNFDYILKPELVDQVGIFLKKQTDKINKFVDQ